MKKSVSFELFGQKFTATSYPTVGQIMEIENYKQELTNGRYGSMVKSNTVSSRFALDLVDAIAYFSVLFGKGMRVMIESKIDGVDNIYDMPGISAKEFVTVYREKFFPWIKEFSEELYKTTVDENPDEQGEE